MSSKHAQGDESDPGAKNVHETVNLEVKLDAIRRMVSADRADDVGRHLGLPPTTVTPFNNGEK